MSAPTPIQAGDLVIVVRGSPCCGSVAALGRIYMVSEIVVGVVMCTTCGHIDLAATLAVNPDYDMGGHYLSQLKRIPPLDELESTPAPPEGVPVAPRAVEYEPANTKSRSPSC